MKVQAANNYVVLEMIESKREVSPGITLPGSEIPNPRWGRVTSVGYGLPDINGSIVSPDVQEEDTVFVHSHGKYFFDLSKLTDEELKFVVAHYLDILAKWDKENMAVKPFGNYVEIELVKNKEIFKGIDLPDSVKQLPGIGKVISRGPGLQTMSGVRVPITLKEGDENTYVVFDATNCISLNLKDLGIDKVSTLISAGNIMAEVTIPNKEDKELVD